jgi:hypothetical protein
MKFTLDELNFLLQVLETLGTDIVDFFHKNPAIDPATADSVKNKLQAEAETQANSNQSL